MGHVPQDPYFPQFTPRGPSFLDTGACLCALQSTPVASGDNAVWQCIGNQTQGVYTAKTGKWFNTSHDGNNISLPVNDASNGPDTSQPLIFDPEARTLVPLTPQIALNVFDKACTGKNQTTFSTSFYRAAEQLRLNQTPVDAAPCWGPGSVPIHIQSVESWLSGGCSEGFLCTS